MSTSHNQTQPTMQPVPSQGTGTPAPNLFSGPIFITFFFLDVPNHMLLDQSGQPLDVPYEFMPVTNMPGNSPYPQFDPDNMHLPRAPPQPSITSASADPATEADLPQDPHPPGWTRCDDCAKAKVSIIPKHSLTKLTLLRYGATTSMAKSTLSWPRGLTRRGVLRSRRGRVGGGGKGRRRACFYES